MIEELFLIQNRLIKNINLNFKRYLYNEINWNSRLIIIYGSRGTGKTTLVLQYFMEKYNDIKKCLYFSVDNPIVLKTGVYNICNEYFKNYGDAVIIDEVHKQKNWSLEIKALYDSFPNKKIIILGSSTLNLIYEKGDLSRRALIYELLPLSFREYLSIKNKKNIELFTFKEIIDNNIDISIELNKKFPKILMEFKDYLKFGAYPFFYNYSEEEYLTILNNVIDKTIYEDITTIKTLKVFSGLKLKKLIAFLAISKIPLFNLETLKNEIDVTRDTLYDYFDLLERAGLINIIKTKSKNLRIFKNSKILFNNPNIYYAIAYNLWKTTADKGNLRESFFVSQIKSKYKMFSSLKTDFLIEEINGCYEIEIGGKNKRNKKINTLCDNYLFKDNIDIGFSNSIPLFLSGFLY